MGETIMDETSGQGAAHHLEAARQHEAAARAHHEAARHCEAGNFEKAERFGTAAAEQAEVANRHAVEALTLYARHAEQKASAGQEAADEAAASAAKHAAKHAAKDAQARD